MPIPKPNSGESESEFMQRCIEFVINEGTPNEQAVAMCAQQWDNRKSMKDLLQFKNFEIKSYKEDGEDFVIEGYGAVFGNIDSVGDVIEKGAFAKTLMERKDRIAFCLQHNIHEPIGKIIDI